MSYTDECLVGINEGSTYELWRAKPREQELQEFSSQYISPDEFDYDHA
jgi:hypothetical protein